MNVLSLKESICRSSSGSVEKDTHYGIDILEGGVHLASSFDHAQIL